MTKRATSVALSLVLALGAFGALVAVPGLAGVAGAHNDEAALSVESQSATGPLTLDLRISARYTNDDELVESIDLSVTGTGPGGEVLPPTPLTAVPDTVGLYGAELTFPVGGAWALTVTGTDPEGVLTAAVQVTDAEATTTTTAAGGDDEQSSTTTAPPTEDDGGEVAEDDPDLLPIVGGVLAVLVVGGAITYVVVRRRGTPMPDA